MQFQVMKLQIILKEGHQTNEYLHLLKESTPRLKLIAFSCVISSSSFIIRFKLMPDRSAARVCLLLFVTNTAFIFPCAANVSL